MTSQSDPPRLTIAIPIHRAERWVPGIVGNVGKAPEWSRVVISDASGLDDSAARLEDLFAGNPIVEVVKRPDHLDWVAHCNLLLEESLTEFFCWLPQDDVLMSDRYFEPLIEALDRDPGVAVALPAGFSVHGRGRLRRRPEFLVRRRSVLRAERDGGGVDFSINSRLPVSLGFIWKGTFRRSMARPMPAVRQGTSSDVAWAFSMALAGGIVEVPDAIYLKRLHSQSATYLTKQTSGADLLEALVGEANARFPEGGDARGRALEVAELVVASAAAARSSHEPGTLKKIIRRLVNEPRPYYE
jgi:hypothetical protein